MGNASTTGTIVSVGFATAVFVARYFASQGSSCGICKREFSDGGTYFCRNRHAFHEECYSNLKKEGSMECPMCSTSDIGKGQG